MEKIYTTEEAANYLGVSASRVRQLILEDRLKSTKMGRDHIILESALVSFAQADKKKPGRPLKK